MNELNRLLDNLESCIARQTGGRKALGELRVYLMAHIVPSAEEEEADEEAATPSAGLEGGEAPIGYDPLD